MVVGGLTVRYLSKAISMNEDEKIAKKYLRGIDNNAVFEPDGNIPPDFSIKNKIGVEVRRLNQQYRKNGRTEGLEQKRFLLLNVISKELEKYILVEGDDKYWLSLSFKRDIGNTKDIKKNLKKAIDEFHLQDASIPFNYKLAQNVSIKFFSKAGTSNQKYKIGMESDRDSAAWVVSMYIEDTTYCIMEKEQKIKPYYKKYEKWWLLLVDHLSCISSYDIDKVVENLNKPNCFEKVIIINLNGEVIIEI